MITLLTVVLCQMVICQQLRSVVVVETTKVTRMMLLKERSEKLRRMRKRSGRRRMKVQTILRRLSSTQTSVPKILSRISFDHFSYYKIYILKYLL